MIRIRQLILLTFITFVEPVIGGSGSGSGSGSSSSPALFGSRPTQQQQQAAQPETEQQEEACAEKVIDQCDNVKQAEIIQDHYMNGFDAKSHISHRSLAKLLKKDYSADCTINEILVDGIPHTYHGKRGAWRACQDQLRLLLSMDQFKIDHIHINNNHAQVIWHANSVIKNSSDSSEPVFVVGTDSYTFDNDNHITSQTVIAALSPSSPPE